MKGFIIFNNRDGSLIYNRYLTNNGILSKDGYKNLCFDQTDPSKIASQFFNLMQMGRVMEEEYKEEFPDDNDPSTRMAFHTGFQSYKSESVDYLLEHHDTYPFTLVLFYDDKDLDEKVMRYLTIRLLDIYIIKKAQILKDNGNIQKDTKSTEDYETAFALILENVSKLFEFHSKTCAGLLGICKVGIHRILF